MSHSTAFHLIRSRALRAALAAALVPLLWPSNARGQSGELPTIEETAAGMEDLSGFFNLYWDPSTGSLFWEIEELDTEFLYQVSMGSGLGSNPVGIDRGQLRGTYVLEATRVGPRVLLMERNYQFQARSDNPTEVQAVRDVFAPSVHWGFDVAAESGERVLVDATSFFLRDARGVIEQLARRGTGRLRARSVPQRDLSPQYALLPREHGGRGDADFHQQQPRRVGEWSGGDGQCCHATPAPLLRSIARWWVPGTDRGPEDRRERPNRV